MFTTMTTINNTLINKMVTIPPDLQLHLTFEPNSYNGSVITNFGTAGNATNVGTTVNTTSFAKGFSSAAFNGSNGSINAPLLTFPNSSVVGNGFTFSFWIKTAVYNSNTLLFRCQDPGTYWLTVTMVSNTNLQWYTNFSGTGIQTVDMNATYADDTWHHYVVTVEVTNSTTGVVTTTIYFDGTVRNTNTTNVYAVPVINNLFSIGRNAGYGTPYFNGSMDDFRFYSRPISAAEVTSLYTTIIPNKIYAYTFEGNNLNDSFNSNHATASGTVLSTTNPKFGTYCLGGSNFFSANTTNYVNTPIINGIVPANGLSFSFWIYSAGNPFGGDCIVVDFNGTAGSLFMMNLNGTNNFQMVALNNAPITLNVWHHMVICWTGNSAALYIDNVLREAVTGTNTLGGYPTGTSLNAGRIGKSTTAHKGFNGSFDMMKAYNKILTLAEINALYLNIDN